MTEYRIENTFMLRAPLLSVKTLEEISGSASIADTLRKYYSLDIIKEALFLASPELCRKALEWMDSGLPDKKTEAALLKYLVRMSSRCTPFGLFAGVCTGTFGVSTQTKLAGPEKHSLHSRPDMQILCTTAENLVADREIRRKLKLYPNSSLFRVGDEFRYIEYNVDEESVRKYHLQQTNYTEELDKVLSEATKGPTIAELTEMLATDGISGDEAGQYIHTLIDNQVLTSDLEPTVNGKGFFYDLEGLLKEIDKRNYQADLKLECETCELEGSIRSDLGKIIPVLKKLSRPAKNPLMDRFKEKFMRRYEGKEVPLNLVLDTEAGTGYLPGDENSGNSALLEGIQLPGKETETWPVDWAPVDSMLLARWQEAMIRHDSEIRITPGDLEMLPEPGQEFPHTISIMAKLTGTGDDGYNIQVLSAGGNSAINLAGRFCYLDDDLHATMKNIAQKEQELAGDAIVAEILHLPQQRTGNILLRPVLYDHEIPYLARSTANTDHQIPVSDLMVSVENNMVRLRSKKLGKWIIPRLSNAHNYSLGALAIYRFLCDLQSQNIRTMLGFSWGPLEQESIYLPRVCYRNFILSPASWNLRKKVMGKTLEGKEKVDVIRKLRRKYNIPREVLLTAADNELWLDLEIRECIDIFMHEMKKREVISLKEYIKDESGIVTGPDGTRSNEFVFFMTGDK